VAGEVLRTAPRSFPFLERIFADAGYQGPKMAKLVARTGTWTVQIVKRSDAHRFVILPKRWIVERTFAGISRNRHLARDFERYANPRRLLPPPHDPHHAAPIDPTNNSA
jgi:DDE family transposase